MTTQDKETDINKIWNDYRQNKSPELRDQLIIEYSPIVRYVAGRLAIHLGSHMDFDDLISCGIFGLIDAIDKYDMLKGVKFETYASLRIRGAIIDSIRQMDWVPRSLRQKNKKLEKIYRELGSELGRDPTDEELAKELSLSTEETRELVKDSAILSLISLDDYMEQNYDNFENPETPTDTPESHLNKQELRRILTEAIEDLSEKEKLVVSLHYFDELNLREISKVLKVSESRISQIHSKALLKMQSKLGKFKSILFSG